jgi:hypothetical protein
MSKPTVSPADEGRTVWIVPDWFAEHFSSEIVVRNQQNRLLEYAPGCFCASPNLMDAEDWQLADYGFTYLGEL